MLLLEERVPGQPAPGGYVGRRAGIEGDDLDDLARPHPAEPALELEHELTAAEVAGIPFVVHLEDPIAPPAGVEEDLPRRRRRD